MVNGELDFLRERVTCPFQDPIPADYLQLFSVSLFFLLSFCAALSTAPARATTLLPARARSKKRPSRRINFA